MPYEPRQDEKHPVTSGLIALVAVTLAVGLVLGIVALVGSHVLGFGGSDDDSGSAYQTLYLPTPVPTSASAGPLITLVPHSESASAAPPDTASASASDSSSPAHQITLSAGETSVSPMQQIDLTGVYPGGEGAILQVQRKLDGKWQDFLSVNTAVSGGQFSTYVQTGQTGVQAFRMRDTTSGEVSNVVKVTVG